MAEGGKDHTLLSTFRVSHSHFEIPKTSSRFLGFPHCSSLNFSVTSTDLKAMMDFGES